MISEFLIISLFCGLSLYAQGVVDLGVIEQKHDLILVRDTRIDFVSFNLTFNWPNSTNTIKIHTTNDLLNLRELNIIPSNSKVLMQLNYEYASGEVSQTNLFTFTLKRESPRKPEVMVMLSFPPPLPASTNLGITGMINYYNQSTRK